MRLYLVQHGEAQPAAVDPERPLTERGVAEVGRVGAFLAAAGVTVERILHSDKRRAMETAARLGDVLDVAPELQAGLSPNAPLEPFLAEALSWRRDTMVVGHLPFMARLVDRLTTGREDSAVVAFRPGSVVCLERTDPDHWTILWMVRPELV